MHPCSNTPESNKWLMTRPLQNVLTCQEGNPAFWFRCVVGIYWTWTPCLKISFHQWSIVSKVSQDFFAHLHHWLPQYLETYCNMASAHNNTMTSGKVSETQEHLRGAVSFCCHSSLPWTSSLRDWFLVSYHTTLQPDNEMCQRLCF